MKKIIGIICSLILLISCSQNNPAEKGLVSSSDSVKLSAVSENVELSGLYADRHFTNCAGSEAAIAVEGDLKKLDSIYSNLVPNAYPGQTIFIKVKGALAGTLTVKEIVSAEQKNDKNTCIPYDYWCMGNEPFWRIQISEKENLIDFYDPMVPKFYHFKFSAPVIAKGTVIYTSEDKGNKIKITVISAKCSDGMSDREYKYSSEVILNGAAYKGCAVKYGDK
ncbi:MAG: hypothetical protein V4608_05350 [Bacteroidota bacterium]